jgi:diketogulonate reductase-like aldo/keto reductase
MKGKARQNNIPFNEKLDKTPRKDLKLKKVFSPEKEVFFMNKNNADTPTFIYGTAWKEDETKDLVKLAIKNGFRAIDTANQPKHYQEPLVGEALHELYKNGLKREDIFLQTKFTPEGGHDERVPYDLSKNLCQRVEESFEKSLSNLGTHYIDSYLLHGPHSFPGLGKEDHDVWKTIERLWKKGKIKNIGISNVNREQLEILTEIAEIAPTMIQNRCYANRAWDRDIRDFCKENNIVYQGFSLLTANPFVLRDPRVVAIAERFNATTMQIIFRFAIQVGIVPLTGTTDPVHMRQDLEVTNFDLTPDDLGTIENLVV